MSRSSSYDSTSSSSSSGGESSSYSAYYGATPRRSPAVVTASSSSLRSMRKLRPTPHLASTYDQLDDNDYAVGAFDRSLGSVLFAPIIRRFLIGFLLLSVVLLVAGALATFIPDDAESISGSTLFRWSVLATVVLLGYFVALIVTWVLIAFTKALSMTMVWHFLSSLARPIAMLLYTLGLWVLFKPILGDDLDSDVSKLMTKLLLSLLIIGAVFCLVGIAVTLVEMSVTQHLVQRAREARVIDRLMHIISAQVDDQHAEKVGVVSGARLGPSGHRSRIKSMGKVTSTPIIGVMQSVSVAAEITTLKLKGMCPRFPPVAETTDEVKRGVELIADTLMRMIAVSNGPPSLAGQDSGKRGKKDGTSTGQVILEGDFKKFLAENGFSPNKSSFLADLIFIEADRHHAKREVIVEALTDVTSRRITLVNDIAGHNLIIQLSGNLLSFVAIVISLLLFMDAVGVDLAAIFIPFSAMFFGFSFAFSGPIAEFVRGFIFVFFRRAYELGDWVTVNDGPELVVKSFTTLTSVFQTLGGHEVSYSNAVLANAKLSNLRRSSRVGQAKIYRLRSITGEDIKTIKSELSSLFKTNPKLFEPNVAVMVSDAPNDGCIMVKVVFGVRTTWNQKGVYGEASSIVHLKMRELISDLGLEGGVDYKVLKTE